MTVELRNGDTLRVVCEFQHIGKAYSGAYVKASIGKPVAFDAWDEISGWNDTVTITGIINDPDWTTYRVTIDIGIYKIDDPFGPKTGDVYGIQVELRGIPGPDIKWRSPMDLLLRGPAAEEAEFQNLSVSYAKA